MKTTFAIACLLGAGAAATLGGPALGLDPATYRRMSPQPRQSNSTQQWPYGPLSTKGRDIVNSRGDVINWAGVNWPMSGETMIPEGLEWASVDNILDDVADVGWNIIRM